ncbi:MAG: SPFH domain-containing protein [Christensenellaceae bacterium]|jgi:membrane protease subunit (stomatin/prohibitin family)|nr:SPFH domain-containing protein [Christensenellaceae bacterium]
MGFIKNQLLKVIEWTDLSKDTIVYRYPMDGRQIMMGSSLTVRESQVAIFVNKGKVADIFGPGKHILTTSNLPFLTTLLSLPYGFKSPFYSEVYFVNTKQFPNQKWGTSNPITMRDKEFGVIRIKAFGKYSFRVDDAGLFLKELFGTNASFTTGDINEYLRSILISGISDTIAESKISAIDLSCNLLEFSKVAAKQVTDHFKELGLAISNLIIENVSFPEAVEKAIDTRSSMGVMGETMDTYMKYQTANAIGDAAKNPGAGGSLAGLGVALGTGQVIGDAMKDSFKAKPQEEVKKRFCTDCGASINAGAKFCNECGAKQTVAADVCPKCGDKVAKGAKFCPHCGQKL